MKYSGVVPDTNMLTALRKADNLRLKNSARKITEKCRLHRRKLRAKKKTSQKEKTTYMAGGFGLGTKPEDVTGILKPKTVNQKRKAATKNKKVSKTSKKQKVDVDFTKHNTDESTIIEVPITFIHDDTTVFEWVHIADKNA